MRHPSALDLDWLTQNHGSTFGQSANYFEQDISLQGRVRTFWETNSIRMPLLKKVNTDDKSNERYFSSSAGHQLSNVETSEHRTKTLTKQNKDQRDSFSEIKTVSPKYKNETASLKYNKYKIIRSSTSFENQNNAVQGIYIRHKGIGMEKENSQQSH